MFISKMTLTKESRYEKEFWKMFDSEYALHQAVWDLFGDRSDRERDFLYRLEDVGKWPVVYTVSKRSPVDSVKLWNIQTKEYAPQLKMDTRLGFSVRVNPTRKRDGKRHDVVMDLKYRTRLENPGEEEIKPLAELVTDACPDWLKERGKKNGFDILSIRADGYRQSKFTKSKGGALVKYSTVDFTGVLKVNDEKEFTKVLFNGVGPEKGFGCGLMLVRRI